MIKIRKKKRFTAVFGERVGESIYENL